MDAPDAIAPIHDRMPAIINEENLNTWLDPSTPVDVALKCLYDPANVASLVSFLLLFIFIFTPSLTLPHSFLDLKSKIVIVLKNYLTPPPLETLNWIFN